MRKRLTRVLAHLVVKPREHFRLDVSNQAADLSVRWSFALDPPDFERVGADTNKRRRLSVVEKLDRRHIADLDQLVAVSGTQAGGRARLGPSCE